MLKRIAIKMHEDLMGPARKEKKPLVAAEKRERLEQAERMINEVSEEEKAGRYEFRGYWERLTSHVKTIKSRYPSYNQTFPPVLTMN